MIHPGAALGLFVAATALLTALLWPRTGILARVVRVFRMTERVRVEDALKHLLADDTEGRTGTADSLAGALGISRGRAVALMGRLVTLGVARVEGEGLRLTEEGREYGLRVLRTHRLWERYLADRTGVAPTEWHDEADIQEHLLTQAETEALAARMGHPLYDPHGDPIPTADGKVPARGGVALSTLGQDDLAVIVHVEDEPREIYDRLVTAGLSPRMQVHVLSVSVSGIRFRAGGRELELTPIQANNVTVEPLPSAAADRTEVETLATLAQGESAGVVQISAACQGPQRRRLLDLGVVPGTVITAELVSTGGDPVAYRIRGALIALRREQASWIEIDRRLEEVA